jgi:hypothetical protein
VYELLHYKHGQASNMLHSLDIPWGYQFVRKNIHFQALLDQPSLVGFVMRETSLPCVLAQADTNSFQLLKFYLNYI